ncbi:MAG: ferritin-like domain-containing protein, partial [Halarsenatibacteraceae bacterium]
FMQLHEFTEGLYDEFFVMFDDIAEIMKMKGEMPLVKINDYLENATIDELPAKSFSYDEVIEAVQADLIEMKSLAVKIREEADEVDDFEVVAKMEDHVAFYSKNLWFIRSMTS